MLNETLLMVALASGSGSVHLGRRKDVFDFSSPLLNVKAIERTEKVSRVWLDNIIGSGATLFPEPSVGTGSLVLLIDRETNQSGLKREVTTENLASIVAKIQSVFSLNISEVASVVGVQRPTIYAWANGDSIPHDSNYRRLQHLYNIAEVMQTKFGTKLSKLQKGRNVEGLSLIDLLSREKINQEEVVKHMSTLVGTSGQQESRVRSFREMAKAANKSISANQNGQKTIDHLTGKRVAED
jgi:transcriptional regulator with XRE-family HTH domain